MIPRPARPRAPPAPNLLPALVALLLALVCLPVASAFSELKGTHLRGCVLLENPYVISDPTRRTRFSGIAVNYLERLQDNLEFTIDLDQWNNSFKDFINTMAECSTLPASQKPACPCDIGVGSFTKTNEREELINFVAPFSNEAHKMVSRKSDLRVDDSKNTWFVFKTFTPSVWGIIGVGVFMHAIGTLFFGPFREKSREASRTAAALDPSGGAARGTTQMSRGCWLVKRFPAAMLFAYAHLVGHPFGERSQGTPSFHRSAWLVLGVTTGLFLLTIYEASLTVLLFESTRSSPFRTLSDITDCNLDPSRVAMINGGASQDFWNSAVNTSHNIRKCGWETAGMTVQNLEQGFMFVQEEKADYFYSLEGSVLFRANRNCEDFEPVGEPFFSTSVAFVMSGEMNETLHQILSRETRILREQDAFPSARLVAARNSCDEVVDATISSGKLVAFFAMYGIAWAVLLLYRCVFLWKRHRDPSKNQDTVQANDIVVMDMHAMPTRNITGVAGVPERPYDPFYAELAPA